MSKFKSIAKSHKLQIMSVFDSRSNSGSSTVTKNTSKHAQNDSEMLDLLLRKHLMILKIFLIPSLKKCEGFPYLYTSMQLLFRYINWFLTLQNA